MIAGVPARARSRARDLLLLVNSSCLDAPLVCVFWAAGLGHAFGSWPGGRELALLFAGVWLGYSADRLADGLRVSFERAGTHRHRFAIVHRRPLLVAWVLVAVLSAAVAPLWLSSELAPWAVAVAVLSALYTWSVQRWPAGGRRLVPRELVVGGLLAWTTAAFAVGGLPRGPVLLASLGLAAVFALDCWAISLSERQVDLGRGEGSWSRTPLGGLGPFHVASLCLASGFAAHALFGGGGPSSTVSGGLCLAAIGQLVVFRRASDRELLPVLSDLALCAAVWPLA